MRAKIQAIDPTNLRKLIDNGQVLLIDVREHLEYREEHISKAQLYPTSKFNPRELPDPVDKKIVFYCLSGKRSAAAGAKWAEYSGEKEAYCLQGGLESWKKMGFPTVVDMLAERKVEHQAYIIAGALACGGSMLALLVSWWFLIIPILTGLLLIFSGFAGHCYLSYLLSKLPFNK